MKKSLLNSIVSILKALPLVLGVILFAFNGSFKAFSQVHVFSSYPAANPNYGDYRLVYFKSDKLGVPRPGYINNSVIITGSHSFSGKKGETFLLGDRSSPRVVNEYYILTSNQVGNQLNIETEICVLRPPCSNTICESISENAVNILNPMNLTTVIREHTFSCPECDQYPAGSCEVWYDAYYTYGVSPKRPDSLKIKDKEAKYIIDKATEGDTIKFSVVLPEGNKFLIEKSLNGGQSWTALPGGPFSNGAVYVVDSMSHISYSSPGPSSGKRILFRARTYLNEDPIIGKSYGFIQMPIDVFAKPECHVADTIYYCQGAAGADTVAVTNIHSSPDVNRIILKLEVMTNNQFKPYEYFDSIVISPSASPVNRMLIFSSNALEAGRYRVVLENEFLTNGQPLQCGHSYFEFVVKQRKELTQFFENSIAIDCKNGMQTVNLYSGVPGRPANITLEKCNSSNTSCVPVSSPAHFQGSAGVHNFRVYYNDAPDCIQNFQVNIGHRFPEITINSLTITYACAGEFDSFLLQSSHIAINNPSGNTNYNLKYKIGSSHNWFVPGTPISSQDIGTVVNNKVLVSVGVFSGNALKCTYTKEFGYNPRKPISFQVGKTDVQYCETASNASITLSNLANAAYPCKVLLLRGGLIVDSLNWASGQASVKFLQLPVGKYSIELTDNNGCVGYGSAMPAFIGQPFSIQSVSTTGVSPCSYSSNGSVSITTQGAGSGAYQVSLNGGAWVNSNSISGLEQGTYTVHARPVAEPGCAVQGTAVVSGPVNLVISAKSITHPACFGANTGKIELAHAPKEQEDVVYQKKIDNKEDYWVDLPSNYDLDLFAGAYIYRVVNTVSGCESQPMEIVLTHPQKLVATLSNVTNPLCNGQNGSISFSGSGGTPGAQGYAYSLLKAGSLVSSGFLQGSKTLALPHGNYVLRLSDSKGCVGEVSFSIVQPPPISFQYQLPDFNGYPIACYGGALNLEISVLGGTPSGNGGYSFATSMNSDVYSGSSFNLSGLMADIPYVFTATDANQCEATHSLTLSQPPAFTATLGHLVHPACSGQSNGEIALSAQGGVPPYSYSFFRSQDSFSIQQSGSLFEGLGEGSYYLHANDANHCRFPAQQGDFIDITLMAPAPMAIQVDSLIRPSCYGFADGRLKISLSGREGELKLVELYRDGELKDSWSGHSEVVSFTGLSSGDYTLRFSESGGPCFAEQPIALGQPAELGYALQSENVRCINTSSGKVEVQAGGGNVPYTVSLYNGSNQLVQTLSGMFATYTFENLYASDYHIVLADKHGCPVAHPQETIAWVHNPDAALEMQLEQTAALCYGDSNGEISVGAWGGWGAYQYSMDGLQWHDAGASFSFEGLQAGQHTVFMRDFMHCELTGSIVVQQPDVLLIDSVVSSPVSCFEGSNGSLEIFASGGNGSYEYDFGNGFVGYSQQGQLAAGAYSLGVRDYKGCLSTTEALVVQPSQFELLIIQAVYQGGFNISCHGLTDTVSLLAGGATAPYTFSLNGAFIGVGEPSQLFNIMDVGAGNWNLLSVDANGCEYDHAFSMLEPEPLSFETIEVVQPKCHNGADGSIELQVFTGGATPYDFELFAGATMVAQVSGVLTHTFEELASGSYRLNAIDANGCTAWLPVFVGQPEPVRVDSLIAFPLLCKGDGSGSIVAHAGGGVGNYSYQWFDADFEVVATGNPLENSTAGLYYVGVTDGHGCPAINPETSTYYFERVLLEPQHALMISDFTSTAVTCYGLTDGVISLSSSGGWDNEHVYALDEGPFMPLSVFEYLPAGTYTLRVRDGQGCIVSQSIDVQQPDSLVLDFVTVLDVDCYGNSTGLVLLEAQGGNQGYAYGLSLDALGSAPLFGNLPAGSYAFFVRDSLGCHAEAGVEILQPEAVNYSVANVQLPQCGASDGSFEVLPLGGNEPFEIQWTSHNLQALFQVAQLEADFYHFRLEDAKGCAGSFTYALTTANGPAVSAINAREPSCEYRSDGVVEVVFEEGYDVQGIYMSNAAGQTWQGVTAVNQLPGGFYYLRALDTEGCASLSTLQLNTPQPLAASLLATPVICWGEASGSGHVNVSGGTAPYTVEWYGQDGNFAGSGHQAQELAAGFYYALVSDAQGCGFASDTLHQTALVEIKQAPEPLELSVGMFAAPVCAGGSNGYVSLTASGGWGAYKYGVNGHLPQANPLISGLTAGEHELWVVDKHACRVVQRLQLQEPPAVLVQVGQTQHVKCAGGADGSVWISAVNGLPPYSYSIDNGASWNNHGVFNNLTSGKYTILARDKEGCVGSNQVRITQPERLHLEVDSVSPSYCGASNGFILLSASGGVKPYSILWEPLAAQGGLYAGNLQAGSYRARITDANTCSNQIDIDVPVIEGPRILTHSTVPTRCHDTSDGQLRVDFTGLSAPFSYFLNGQAVLSNVLNTIPKGIHEFVVRDGYGCADTLGFSMNGPEAVVVSFGNVVHPLCYDYSNGSLEAQVDGGTPPYVFLWTNGSTENALSKIKAGVYAVFVADSHQCSTQTSLELHNPPPILIDLPASIALCQGQTIVLDAQNQGNMHWWRSSNGFESFQQVVSLEQAGEYYLQVTNPKGCFARDTVVVSKYDYQVNSTLLVPHIAKVGDTLVVVDISWPIPESITWHIPDVFHVLVDNPYDKQLVPMQEGVFPIGLSSYTGQCASYMEKAVYVSGFNQPAMPRSEQESGIIKWVRLMPNPAQCHTRLDVELTEVSDIYIEVVNGFGHRLHRQRLEGAHTYSHDLELRNIPPGIYMVRVSAGGYTKTARLIVL